MLVFDKILKEKEAQGRECMPEIFIPLHCGMSAGLFRETEWRMEAGTRIIMGSNGRKGAEKG